MQKHDLIIIGAGLGGIFAAMKIAEQHKSLNTLLIDLGASSAKRRRQCESYMGLAPSANGQLYTSDYKQILTYVDGRKVKAADKYAIKHLSTCGPTKVTQDKTPTAPIKSKISKLNFDLTLNDYIQWAPKNIHDYSKYSFKILEDASNIHMSFNNEVHAIKKVKGGFQVESDEEVYFAKRVLLATGRSGWRWITKLYEDFDIVLKDNIASYGIRIETSCNNMKEWNKSHCQLDREDISLGKFYWNGTVTPTDYADVVLQDVRTNESRWKSDKCAFSLIKHLEVEDGMGARTADRISKLCFLMLNDRIGKEKVRAILKKQSALSQLPEFDWLIPALEELTDLFPFLTSKANFHAPDIICRPAQIRIGDNLETEIPGLYVCGENAGFNGLMGAAISGALAGDFVAK